MKLKTIFSLTIISLLSMGYGSAQAFPQFAAYWTSWGTSTVDLSQLSSKVTTLNLSFVNVDANTLKPVGSDGMLDSTSGTRWKQAPYNLWTNFKLNHPNVKTLLSFGGATYADLWTTTLTAENATTIAKNIAVVVNASYPVYSFDAQYIAHIVGHVTLDGVDLDVEGSGTLTPTEAQNVVLLISALRQEMPNKIITLTSFSTAADPASCQTTAGPDCSYSGSSHSGEILPVLTQVTGLVNWVNDMAYDAGKNYNYQLSLTNYAKYIDKNKIMLGLDLASQWDPNGNFVESQEELNNRAKWADENGYGAMVWAIGANGGYALDQQINIINQLAIQ